MSATFLRPQDDQNVWNFWFSLFFLAVLIEALVFLHARTGGFPRSISVFDALLMALAAFRVTRLIVYDKITRWFRELFVEKRAVIDGEEKWVEIRSGGLGIRTTIFELMQCPWCIGFWSALAIAVFYFTFDWAWFVIFFLALAGTGTLLQLLANLIGWKAENLKLDTQAKEGS